MLQGLSDSLRVSDVRQGSVEGDAIADVYVESVLSVGLVHTVRVGQRIRPALLADSFNTHHSVTIIFISQLYYASCDAPERAASLLITA